MFVAAVDQLVYGETGLVQFKSTYRVVAEAMESGRLSEEIQRDQTAQSAGLREPGGFCGAKLSMPSSGRASPSLHWAWTKNKRKHKLKPVLGLTNQWSGKVNPLSGRMAAARSP